MQMLKEAGAGAGQQDTHSAGAEAQLDNALTSLRVLNPEVSEPFRFHDASRGYTMTVQPDGLAKIEIDSPEKLFTLNLDNGMIYLPDGSDWVTTVAAFKSLDHYERTLITYWALLKYKEANPEQTLSEFHAAICSSAEQARMTKQTDEGLSPAQQSLSAVLDDLSSTPFMSHKRLNTLYSILSSESGGTQLAIDFVSSQCIEGVETHFKTTLPRNYYDYVSSPTLGDSIRALVNSSVAVFKLYRASKQPSAASAEVEAQLGLAREALQERFDAFLAALRAEKPILFFQSHDALANESIMLYQTALNCDDPDLFKAIYRKISSVRDRARLTQEFFGKHSVDAYPFKGMTTEQLKPLIPLAESLCQFPIQPLPSPFDISDDNLYLVYFYCESIKTLVELFTCFHYAEETAKTDQTRDLLIQIRKKLNEDILSPLYATGPLHSFQAHFYYYLFDYIPDVYDALNVQLRDADVVASRGQLYRLYTSFAPDCANTLREVLSPFHFKQKLDSSSAVDLPEMIYRLPPVIRRSSIIISAVLQNLQSIDKKIAATFLLSSMINVWEDVLFNLHQFSVLQRAGPFRDNLIGPDSKRYLINYYQRVVDSRISFSPFEYPTFLSDQDPTEPVNIALSYLTPIIARLYRMAPELGQPHLSVRQLTQVLEGDLKTNLKDALSQHYALLFQAVSTGGLWHLFVADPKFTSILENPHSRMKTLLNHLPRALFEMVPEAAYRVPDCGTAGISVRSKLFPTPAMLGKRSSDSSSENARHRARTARFFTEHSDEAKTPEDEQTQSRRP